MSSASITFRRFREGETRFSSFQEDIVRAGHSHKCPVYVHRTPPCQGSCPSGEDIRGWLRIVRGLDKPLNGMSWQEYAFRRLTEANPFPAIMGRVCPAPCEDGCNRNALDDHVGINSIEHFIGDYAIQAGFQFDKPARETGRRVALVGGGPASLSCAYQLRRMGHTAVLFEEHEALGGMMRYGIPGYRTPREVLDQELARILALGVTVNTGTRVGRDVTIEQLESDFDAVFWGIGTQSGRPLPIPGADAPNCMTGIAFLRAFNEGRLHYVPERIIVVGGGDTSIDVASVARRLGRIEDSHDKDRAELRIMGRVGTDAARAAKERGAAEVTLTSVFPREQMTASEREVAEALSEGVEIRCGIMPVEVVLGDDGKARALRMAECDIVDNQPVPRPGTEFELPCDLVVVAIGQKGDFQGIEALDNGRGLIEADAYFQVKGRRGHFVGGDIVRPHWLTSAIGQGWIAARSIDHYLEHAELPRRPKVDVHHFDLIHELCETGHCPKPYSHEPVRGTFESDFAVHNYDDRADREIITHEEMFLGHYEPAPRHIRKEIRISADEVLGNFSERLECLSEEDTVAEAERCMSCGLCIECDNCVIYCPQTAVRKVPASEAAPGRYVETDYTRCVGCHVCADVCPTGYIQMAL